MTHHHLHTHLTYTHTCTPHTHSPSPPPGQSCIPTHRQDNTQSETDQTGNSFILQHVALSFVWRDPAVVSDCMQRAKAHINSLVTFVVVPCSVERAF